MNIYPSILTDSLSVFIHQVEAVKECDDISTLQIDVIDGYFADNLTVTPADLFEVDFGELQIDLHLMTEEPLDYIYEFLERKNELPVRAIIAQIEKMSYQLPFVEEAVSHQWQVGLSLDLFTPLEAIDPAVWPQLDIVQLMSVEAGYQGQSLKPQTFEKIAKLKTLIPPDRNIEIITDGGINFENISQIMAAGADSIAVGSLIWNSQNIPGTISQLQEFTHQGDDHD